jgi:hypothetical protein
VTWYEAIPRVSWSLIDRDGTLASHDLHFSVESDLDSLWAAVQLESRFMALTECALYARTLTVGQSLVGAPEPTGTVLQSGILMLHSEMDTYTSIMIPGIRSDLFVADSCFIAQKIDMLNADIVALSNAILVAQLVTPRGDLILDVSSGGFTQMWQDLNRRSG